METNFTPAMAASTRYIPASIHRDARIRVESWFEGSRKYYPYDYSESGTDGAHRAAFLQWCSDVRPDVPTPLEVCYSGTPDGRGYTFQIVRA